MPMSRIRVAALSSALVTVCLAGAVQAASLRGSVFLMPVDSQFSSVGSADFLNDLNQVDSSATLSGAHSVNGPSNFVSAVQGSGSYFNILEGPAAPGACYDTTLHVVGDPPGLFNTLEETWTGDTRCAPAENPDDPSGGGDEQDDGCPTSNPNCNNSPLILDLGTDNYRLTSLAAGVRFDLRNEGYAAQTAWTRTDTEIAFLALDRNGNGRIDDGSELFGTATPLRSGVRARNGFAALAELDDNADARIDAGDRVWSTLLLWTDRNHDGDSSPAELRPVAGSVVTALQTEYRTIGKRDRWGNLFRCTSTFRTRENGNEHRRSYYDVFFQASAAQ
jgi:hypothetical protein